MKARWFCSLMVAAGVLGNSGPAAGDSSFPLALRLGMGISTALQSNVRWSPGWAFQASALVPTARGWLFGLAFNLRDDYLDLGPFDGHRYMIMELSSILGYRMSTSPISSYGRLGIGMAYVNYSPGRAGFPAILGVAGSKWAPALQLGAGLELPLGGGIEVFIDAGVDAIRGTWPYTSGALILGLAARR